jgi:hypothetical protein
MKIRLTLAMLFVLGLGTSAYYNQASSTNLKTVWTDGNNPPPPPCCDGDPGMVVVKSPLPKPPSQK